MNPRVPPRIPWGYHGGISRVPKGGIPKGIPWSTLGTPRVRPGGYYPGVPPGVSLGYLTGISWSTPPGCWGYSEVTGGYSEVPPMLPWVVPPWGMSVGVFGL